MGGSTGVWMLNIESIGDDADVAASGFSVTMGAEGMVSAADFPVLSKIGVRAASLSRKVLSRKGILREEPIPAGEQATITPAAIISDRKRARRRYFLFVLPKFGRIVDKFS